MFGFGGID